RVGSLGAGVRLCSGAGFSPSRGSGRRRLHTTTLGRENGVGGNPRRRGTKLCTKPGNLTPVGDAIPVPTAKCADPEGPQGQTDTCRGTGCAAPGDGASQSAAGLFLSDDPGQLLAQPSEGFGQSFAPVEHE